MTIAQAHFQKLWRNVTVAWNDMLSGKLQATSAPPRLAEAMHNFLSFQDLVAASKLRYRALKQVTILPPITESGQDLINYILDRNQWANKHFKQTQPVVQWVVSQAVKSEQAFVEAQALNQEAGLRNVSLPGELFLERQRRFGRDRMMEVVNTAEQVQLADPHIGDRFPMSVYHSREDRRVRPTHDDMDGTIAVRAWEGWRWCRPPCGYGCRCGLRHLSLGECVRLGYFSRAGKPRFEVKWSKPKAKANYLRGVPFHDNTDTHAFGGAERDRIFPDVGPWMAGKFTAATGYPIEQV